MNSLMAAFFPAAAPGGVPGGSPIPLPGAGEEHQTFMHHFHQAFGRLVATNGSGLNATHAAAAAAPPPFDPSALFRGQPAAEAVAAAPAAAALPVDAAEQAAQQAHSPALAVASDDVKQEEQGEERSPALATPAAPAQLADEEAQAEAINNSGGNHALPAVPASAQAAPAAAAVLGEQQQQQQAAAAAGVELPVSGSGTVLADAGALAGASGQSPEQAALQQQALYIGQVMMSLASVFPGMAAAISAMCGMAAAAGFAAPQLPPGVQPVAELPQLSTLGMPALAASGRHPFLQTSFGEVLSARAAGVVPKGALFSTALQADGLAAANATPVKPQAVGTVERRAPLEAHTPVSTYAARSSAGRRPLSADLGDDGVPAPGTAAAAAGHGEANPLAFLAIAASMDD